jgi:hypothetical protein
MPIPGNLLTTAMAVMPHEDVWLALDQKGIDREFLLSRSLISPATCCLINPDGETTVEKAFEVVKELSCTLRNRYGLT